MRREGFELQVSKPEVITKEENGVIYEPYSVITTAYDTFCLIRNIVGLISFSSLEIRS